MVCKPAYPFIAFLFILLFHSARTLSQPALPDIAGAEDNGVVQLTWNCQYDGIKSITVLRSTDSMFNFAGIGNVKKTAKGVQSFVDLHPVAGKNFYKLTITFGSGLNWTSNVCKVVNTKPATTGGPMPAQQPASTAVPDSVHPKYPGALAPIRKDSLAKSSTVQMPPKKLSLAFEDPTEKPETFIISTHVFTDPGNGHVRLNMPDDLASHHYAIRFYNSKMQIVTEIPKINSPQLILDKRNFPGKGMYKYVLRRDIVEYESGYININ